MRIARLYLKLSLGADCFFKPFNLFTLSSKTLIALVFGIALTACVNTPDVELKPDLPAKWRNADAANASESSQQNATNAWWLGLNDPVLNKTIELALKQNLSLAQALERISAARAYQLVSNASEKPQIGFSAGPYNVSALPGSGSSRPSSRYILGFDMAWELPLFGRSSAQHKIAEANIAFAEADLNLRQISMVAEIVRQYGELRAAQNRANLLAQTVSRYEDLDKLMQKASSSGLVAMAEVNSAHMALNQAHNALLQNNIQYEIALQRLNVLCGLTTPLPEWLQKSEADWALNHDLKPPVTLPADIIRNRPDIKIAEAAVLKAAGEVGIANADLYPRFSIEGLLGVMGKFSVENSQEPSNTITVLAPSVRLPLLDWGLLRQTVNARDAKLRESILAYREAVLLAIEETEVALSNYNAAENRLSRDDKELNDLHAKVSQAKTAFNAGYLNRLELLRLEVSMMERQSQSIDAKSAWVGAYALANKAMSGNGIHTKE